MSIACGTMRDEESVHLASVHWSRHARATAPMIASDQARTRDRGREYRPTGRSGRRPGPQPGAGPRRPARRASPGGRRERSPGPQQGESASSRLSTCERAAGSPLVSGMGGGQPVGVEPAGRGDDQQPGLGDILADQGVRLDRPRGRRPRSRRWPARPRVREEPASNRRGRWRLAVRRSSPAPAGSPAGSRAGGRPSRRRRPGGAPDAQARSTASSSTKAGSNAVSPGWPMPISGVITDWCAPPSGARLRPDGVATSRNRAPW